MKLADRGFSVAALQVCNSFVICRILQTFGNIFVGSIWLLTLVVRRCSDNFPMFNCTLQIYTTTKTTFKTLESNDYYRQTVFLSLSIGLNGRTVWRPNCQSVQSKVNEWWFSTVNRRSIWLHREISFDLDLQSFDLKIHLCPQLYSSCKFGGINTSSL